MSAGLLRANALADPICPSKCSQATRRSAPDAYNKASIGGARPKSLLGLPWRYAIGCIDTLGLILRAELIWSKPNGLPESVTDRVRRSHEQWFHFTREPRYYASLAGLYEPHLHPSWSRPGVSNGASAEVRGVSPTSALRGSTYSPNPEGKRPDSVWNIPTEPLVVPDHLEVEHFAAFPSEWPRRLIEGWSPPDGVVLDPFGGTGTTAMVARALGRRGVHVDLSADYLRLARWRIFESGGASKARERTNRQRQGALL